MGCLSIPLVVTICGVFRVFFVMTHATLNNSSLSYSVYYVPGTLPNTLCVSTYLNIILTLAYELSTVIINLLIRRLKHKK